jgi:lipopolysaccharide export LptBFGC system permease protein LptF
MKIYSTYVFRNIKRTVLLFLFSTLFISISAQDNILNIKYNKS